MRQQIDLSDHATSVELSGAGSELVVLVHSALLDHRMWAALTDGLTRQLGSGWSFASYDLRGHGDAHTAPRVTGVNQLATDLVEMTQVLMHGRPAHAVGLSLGGAVVQSAAVDAPQLFSTISIVASRPNFPTDAMLKRAQLGVGGVAEEVEVTLDRWLGPGPHAPLDPTVSYIRRCLREVTPELWRDVWTALSQFDLLDQLPRLDAPTLGVAGELDQAAPPAALELLARTVNKGQMTTLPGAGHLCALTHPDELAQELAQFLASHTREVD